MGITGLLPFVKKASKKSHVRNFKGSTVGVDGFSWLHKGAYGCAQKLGTGEPTVAYLNYFMKYVNILREHGIRPVLVFDGRSLPSKAHTDEKRRESRKQNKILAKEALRNGDKRGAWEGFIKSIEITPAMVREVLKVLREEKLDYIIAPYEADAQLAYLANSGLVDLVITEDSDLILFGCKKIFFKLSKEGDGVLFDSSKLHLSMEQKAENFNFEKFRQMCILSGCDYLASLNGIGLGRAKKVIANTKHDDIEKILKQVPSLTNLDIAISEEYISEFKRAQNTFRYQLVFDPQSRSLIPLTPYTDNVDIEQLSFCGEYVDKEMALDMAIGNIDTRSLSKVDSFNIDDESLGYCGERSIWSSSYRKQDSSDSKAFEAPVHSSTGGKTAFISSSCILKKRTIDIVNDEEMLASTDKREELDILQMYKTTVEKKDTKTSNEVKRTCMRTSRSSNQNLCPLRTSSRNKDDLNSIKSANETQEEEEDLNLEEMETEEKTEKIKSSRSLRRSQLSKLKHDPKKKVLLVNNKEENTLEEETYFKSPTPKEKIKKEQIINVREILTTESTTSSMRLTRSAAKIISKSKYFNAESSKFIVNKSHPQYQLYGRR